MAIIRGFLKKFHSQYVLFAPPLKFRYCILGSAKYHYSTSTGTENEDKNHFENHNGIETDPEDIKASILNAALEFVPQYGWSRQALASGAEVIGYPGVAHGMFPQGGAELVHHFYYSSNRNLEEKLKSPEFQKTIDGSDENKETFLRNALEARLRMIIPYLSKWPQAMAIMSIPQNVPRAIRNLQDLVDTIWFYAGDKSTDLRWYGKRLGLSAIYKTSELCLLQDSSTDYNSTWLFLDRRITDYINTKRCIAQMQDANQIMTGGIITIQNMLGVGRISR